MEWYRVKASDVCKELGVDPGKGLAAREVGERVEKFGPNVLARKKKQTLLSIFLSQFKSPLIYILFAAAAVVFALGQIIDSLVILAVLVLNSIIGTFQEGKAKNSLEKLKSLTRHKALVIRDGVEVLIPS